MNTLQLIKKQINKASAVHDAQITHTAYRGVKCEVRKAPRRLTAPSAIAVVPTPNEAIMEALQIAGLITLGCVAGMALYMVKLYFSNIRER